MSLVEVAMSDIIENIHPIKNDEYLSDINKKNLMKKESRQRQRVVAYLLVFYIHERSTKQAFNQVPIKSRLSNIIITSS